MDANLEEKSIEQHITALVEKQRQSFLQEGIVTAESRMDRLNRCISMLEKHEQDFIDALKADYGQRPALQTTITEFFPTMQSLKDARRNVRRWMRPDLRKLPFYIHLAGARGFVTWQPKGVIGIISPWNFPVNLTFVPLAGVLAAGNRAIIKPSEFTPCTSQLIYDLISETFDETEVAVVLGGPETGQIFSRQPFDHLFFTGSTAVGKHVMRAAAEHLVPVTLELGGKSPAIIGQNADLRAAATGILTGKLTNAGQICISPDYAFVPAERLEAFIASVRNAAAALYPTLRGNPDYTSLINQRSVQRLQRYLNDAKQQGAQLVEINPGQEVFSPEEDRRMPLTLVIDPTDEMQVMQDEIFGPILPVKPYHDFQEVIAYINQHGRPLALYYFGKDSSEKDDILAHTTAGGMTINNTLLHISMENLPFGGIGPSGMGNYHGYDGFKTFSHARSVFEQGFFDLGLFTRPPYTEWLEKVVRFMMKL